MKKTDVEALLLFLTAVAGGYGALVVGLPTTGLGVVALLVDRVVWPLVVGLGLVAVAMGCGVSAFLLAQRHARAVVRAEGPTRVFLSYRTAEHGDVIDRIAERLAAQGLEVIYDRAFQAKTTEPTVADVVGMRPAARRVGLFQLGGLDDELQRELVRADALVYFVPTTPRHQPAWRALRDQLDAFLYQLLFQYGLTPASWRFIWWGVQYGKDVRPAMRLVELQSWQSWERSAAEALGLTVVDLLVADKMPNSGPPRPVQVRPNVLDEDVAQRVVPRLRSVRRDPPRATDEAPAIGLLIAGALAVQPAMVATFVVVAAYLVLRWLV